MRRTEKANGRCMLFTGSEMENWRSSLFWVMGRRYKLWWCGNDDKTEGVSILVKEELCKNVVEVRRRFERVMAIRLVIGEEVVTIICAYAPQSGKPDAENERFSEEIVCKWSMANANIEIGRFQWSCWKCGGRISWCAWRVWSIGRRNDEGRMLLDFCDQQKLYCM